MDRSVPDPGGVALGDDHGDLLEEPGYTTGGPGPVLVDVLGLCPYSDEADAAFLAATLVPPVTDYPVVHIQSPEARLSYLAALHKGAGYTVITGPLGIAFWEAASVEVQIRVEPDGYQHLDRVDPMIWGLRQAGLSDSEASALAKKPPKTPRNKNWTKYWAGVELARSLDAAIADAVPLVHESVQFEIIGVEEATKILRTAIKSDIFLATDWEWRRDTQAPVGLAISDALQNYYVPLLGADYTPVPGDTEKLVDVWAEWCYYGVGVMHGGQADLRYIYPVDPEELCGKWVVDDTMLIAYLIGEPILGLKPLTAKYLGHYPIENEYEWGDMPVRFTARYAAAGDTRNTYDLYQLLRKELENQGKQVSIYTEIERPLVPRLASMERVGVPVDIPATMQQHREAVIEEEQTRRAVLEAYGYDLKDDEQTLAFMVACGIENPGTLDQRVISLNQHWCVDLILLYRQTRTRRRNFLGKTLREWAEAGKPEDFRIHPRFNQCGSMDDEAKLAPRSGRLSSAKPNIQQQPRKIRAIFRAPRGYRWWSFDYSGLELRLAAAMSGDKEMWAGLTEKCPDAKCAHFPKHGDLHSRFQYKIFEQTKQMLERPYVKTGNFEQLYFGGEEQLIKILAKERAFITREVSHIICTSHVTTFGGYHAWAGRKREVDRQRGYAETYYGRRRVIPELYSLDSEQLGYANRTCVNHTIQGTGADIVKIAMDKLTPVLRKYGAHMGVQVHDELDGWIPETADMQAFEKEVKEIMEQTINGMVLIVEGGTAGGSAITWEDAH